MAEYRVFLNIVKRIILFLFLTILDSYAVTLECSEGYLKYEKEIFTEGRKDSSNLITELFHLESDVIGIDIKKVWTVDENEDNQSKEQFKLVFVNSKSSVIAQTRYTQDIDNRVDANHNSFTDLGYIPLPNGEKNILLVHRSDEKYADGLTSYNSVKFKGMCYRLREEDTNSTENYNITSLTNPPLANDDTIFSKECKSISINILDNDIDSDNDLNISSVDLLLITNWKGIDSDSDGDIDRVVVPNEGEWRVNRDGLLSFTPSNSCLSSPTRLRYRVKDRAGNLSNKAVVKINYPQLMRASIGNFVWLDENRDGYQNSNELGLKGIEVQLLNKGKELIASTTTDASGKYLFKEVAPAEYYVKFIIPNGYSVTLKRVGEDREKDSDINANGESSLFTLTEGVDDRSIDLGLYPTLVNLGDRVFLDINSNGIQDEEDSEGVSGVKVKLFDENHEAIAQTVTNSLGQYTFRNLSPGNYYVVFDVPKNYKVSPQNQGSNESDDSDTNSQGKTEIITLIAGQDNKSIDMGLYHKSIKVGDKVFYDVNRNGIQDPDEIGVGEVKVKLYRAKNNELIAETKTSASGIYLFDQLLADEYYIVFTKPVGYTITKANQGFNDKIDSDVDSSGRTENFTLVDGMQDSSIDMGIYQDPVSYGGRVFLDTNHNGLQDMGEKGVRDINVTIYSANSSFSKSMLTDENGYYLFTHLAAGEYFSQFRDIPYGYLITEANVNNNAYDVNDSDAFLEDEKIVTSVALLTPGKNDLSWDLGIYKTVCLPGKSVIGNLVFEDFNKNGIQDIGERGVAAVKVTLYNNDTDEKVADTLTDENGLYEFAHIDPEYNYYIQFTVPNGYVVSPKDQESDTIDSDADASGKTEVIVVEADQINSTVDMGIYREGSIIGGRAFFDEHNGISNGIQDIGEVGVNDIKVTLYSAGGVELNSTRTNVSGEYHFTNIPKGRYIIEFSELPIGYIFTSAKQGSNDEKDSDVKINGRTDIIFVDGKRDITSIDAGLKKVASGLSMNDVKSALMGQVVSVDVLANDVVGTFPFDISTVRITSGIEGAILSENGRLLSIPNEGVWRVNSDTGVITFTPIDGFIGDPTPINYSVQDTQGNETGAMVEINYPPLAIDDHFNAQRDRQVTIYILENDHNTSTPLDITSVRLIDPISGNEVEMVTVLNEGTWSVNIDGSVTFTPESGLISNPTPIEYSVREVIGDVSNRATITVVYPDAVDDLITISTGLIGNVSVNVAQNDSNNTIATTVTIGCEQPGSETLVVNGEGKWEVKDSGIIIFSPEDGFVGEPTDIFYTIGLYSGGRSNCARVDIRRELLAVDDTSTLNVGAVSLINILENDLGELNTQSVELLLPLTPVAGSTLSNNAQTLMVPGEGVWQVNDIGILSFTAEDGFTAAPHPIRYTVENNSGVVSNIATVTLTQGGVSVVANDDRGLANGANPIIISVLDNDTGDLNRSSVRIITPDGDEVIRYTVPGEGTWSVGEDGRITFIGESGFFGTPTPIRYIVSDNSVIVLSDTARVTIDGICDCRPYETSIPAMGQLAALSMLILTLLISLLILKEEEQLLKKSYN